MYGTCLDLESSLPFRAFSARQIPTLANCRDGQWATIWTILRIVEPYKKPQREAGVFCMAPRVGIEPTTISLTASRSAAELPRNVFSTRRDYNNRS